MLSLKHSRVLRCCLFSRRMCRAVLTVSGVVLLCVWCSDAEAPTARPVYAEVECPAVVDVRQDGTLTGQAGRKVPKTPEEWMQRTPCDSERDEVAVNGACFLPLERKPPCKSSQYEWQGKCWAAVAKQRRPSTSVQHTLGD